jgi:hypothetical protein
MRTMEHLADTDLLKLCNRGHVEFYGIHVHCANHRCITAFVEVSKVIQMVFHLLDQSEH